MTMHQKLLLLPLLCLCLGLAACSFLNHESEREDTVTSDPRTTVTVKVLPPSPSSYEGLTSYSRVATFRVEATKPMSDPDMGPRPIGFDVRWDAIIHYDRHEGMLRVDDRGHTSLSMSRPSSHTTVLLPGTYDRTYRTYPDDESCRVVEWGFRPSRFVEAYGAVDFVEGFKNYYLLTSDNQMSLIPVGPAEVNGIATDHYRLNPEPTLSRMQSQYPDFDGAVTGEVYLAAGTSALVKAEFRFEGSSLPAIGLPFTSGMMEGTIEMTHEIADLNTAPLVTLQPECEGERLP